MVSISVTEEKKAELLAAYDAEQEKNPQTLEEKKAEVLALYGANSPFAAWPEPLVAKFHRKLKAYGWIK